MIQTVFELEAAQLGGFFLSGSLIVRANLSPKAIRP
jgi:hypothetical protein